MRRAIFFASLIFSVTACGVEHVEHVDSEHELAYGSHTSGILSDNSINGANLPANTVVLTYDDGPDEQTLLIGEYLWQQGIHAVFFANGRRICHKVNGVCTTPPPTTGCPTASGQSNTRIYDESVLDLLQMYGHRIANHTQDHCDVNNNSTYAAQEIRLTQDLLDRHAWDGPYLFRAPYGSWGSAPGQASRADVCLDKIVGHVHWDIDGGDWNCWYSGQTTAQCLAGYLGSLESAGNKGIVLMHDRPEFNVNIPSYYSGPNNTLELTKAFVQAVRDRGLTFGRIEDAVGTGARARNYSFCGNFGDGEGYSTPATYRTVQLADVDGDAMNYSDACARTGQGIVCAKNMGNGQFAASTNWFSTNFTSGQGWDPAQYGSTIRFGDLNNDGKDDVCGRGGAGIYCATANTAGTAFQNFALWTTDYSDAAGWATYDSNYATLRLVDVNNDQFADICGRAPGGISCSLNTHNNSFAPATLWLSTNFSNTEWWNPSQYGATIQFGDVNGDLWADVCGRGGAGIYCAINSQASSFVNFSLWTTDFSDNDPRANGWQDQIYFRSIRLADVDGDDDADVCGRGIAGIWCASSTRSGFAAAQLMNYESVENMGAEYSNAMWWTQDRYASTLNFGKLDANKAMDICGRGGRGLICALSD